MKYYRSLTFFNHLKNAITVLNFWAIQKQAAGQIWPVSHRSPTHGLDTSIEGLEEFSGGRLYPYLHPPPPQARTRPWGCHGNGL